MSKRERSSVISFIRNVARQTTVHGLNIVGLPNLNIFERLFWYGVVLAAAGGAIALVNSNLKRYSANPTVVSIQKDFRNWNNPFPSVTGCFTDKMDRKKAEQLIYEKWGLRPGDHDYNDFFGFIQNVANISYYNFHKFLLYKNNDKLNNVNMLEIAARVHPRMSGTLVTFDTKRNTKWTLIMSELGICFNMNSKFAKYFSFKVNEVNEYDVQSDENILRCHYLNGLCYARYDSDPQLTLQYFIHSYLDVIHTTTEPPLLVHESEELELNYRMQETSASSNIRYLTPSQRRCRFDDEPLSHEFPAYSTSICYVLCRYRLTLKLCGCKPFFYHFLGGKTCDVEGMACLAHHAINLTQSPSQLGCQCPQPCDLITYLPQIPKITKWEHGYFEQRIAFRWGLLPPTTKYYRDVIFGLTDLFVSFGGTVALFLGISCISAIEFVFLIMDGLIKEYRKPKTIRKNKFGKVYTNSQQSEVRQDLIYPPPYKWSQFRALQN